MVHDHALMIRCGRQSQQIHIQICKFIIV